jgi:hypothetical protein
VTAKALSSARDSEIFVEQQRAADGSAAVRHIRRRVLRTGLIHRLGEDLGGEDWHQARSVPERGIVVCTVLARRACRRMSGDTSVRRLPRRVFTIELPSRFGLFDAARLSAAAFGRRTDKKGISRDRCHNPFLRQSAGRAADLLRLPQELRVF